MCLWQCLSNGLFYNQGLIQNVYIIIYFFDILILFLAFSSWQAADLAARLIDFTNGISPYCFYSISICISKYFPSLTKNISLQNIIFLKYFQAVKWTVSVSLIDFTYEISFYCFYYLCNMHLLHFYLHI